MAKEQANYPGSLDILTVDRTTGQAVPSNAFDIIEDAITEIEEELRRVVTKTAAATLTNNEGGMILVSCAVTPYTLFLPTAVGNEGLTYDFIKTDDNTNLITVDADGTETINGSLTYADLNYQWAYITIKSNNVNWVIINSSQTTTIRVTNLISPTSNSINVKPDGDTDDFFTFKSLQDRPTIKREGGKFIYFESSNVYDVGISFRADNTYSGTLNYEKDNHMMTVLGKNSPFGFKANSDYVNYLKVQTVSTIPEITVVASGGLKINAGGTNALLLNHSGGSVGIGTSSPSGTLDINVATDADAHILLSENDVTKWDIYNDHLDDALQIKAGAILVAELDISGNLDIKSGASYKIGGTALAVGDITGAQASLTFGIADTNKVQINSASVVNGEYAKFTATGLESKSFAEIKTDLSLNLVENTALSSWVGTANITTLGTITTGVWSGTALVIGKIPTAVVSNADTTHVPTCDNVYDFCETTQNYMRNLLEDTTPELGGELDCGAHTIGFTQQSTTGDGTTTIDWKLGNKFKFTFGTQNDTFTFTAPTNPCNLILVLIQDGTGSRTAIWPATVKWAGETAPTLTTAANGIDIVSFYWDGTNYFGVASLAFAVPA